MNKKERNKKINELIEDIEFGAYNVQSLIQRLEEIKDE